MKRAPEIPDGEHASGEERHVQKSDSRPYFGVRVVVTLVVVMLVVGIRCW